MAARLVSALERSATKVNSVLRYICVALLFIMMTLGTADVVGRYLFNKPVWGTFEIFGILLASIVLLGLSYTQADRAHVTVDLLITHVPKRVQTIAAIFTTLVALGITILIFWQGLLTSMHNYELGMRIQTIRLPIYLPQLLLPIGALALAYVLLIQLLQDILNLKPGMRT